MPQSPDGLEVEFDVTFPHIPCALLAVDANGKWCNFWCVFCELDICRGGPFC